MSPGAVPSLARKASSKVMNPRPLEALSVMGVATILVKSV